MKSQRTFPPGEKHVPIIDLLSEQIFPIIALWGVYMTTAF